MIPPFECFRDAESYYATLLHELTHWTQHASRLDREFGRKRWGDAGYAAEELVAELGSAVLCADLDVNAEAPDDHSSYLATCLTVLKRDKRAIFTASAHAQRAPDYLHDFQPPIESRGLGLPTLRWVPLSKCRSSWGSGRITCVLDYNALTRQLGNRLSIECLWMGIAICHPPRWRNRLLSWPPFVSRERGRYVLSVQVN